MTETRMMLFLCLAIASLPLSAAFSLGKTSPTATAGHALPSTRFARNTNHHISTSSEWVSPTHRERLAAIVWRPNRLLCMALRSSAVSHASPSAMDASHAQDDEGTDTDTDTDTETDPYGDMDMEMDPEEKAGVLREEFQRITQGRRSLGFREFLRWEEVASLLSDALVSKEELQSIWTAICGSPEAPADEARFLAINYEIDQLFNFENDGEHDGESSEYGEGGEEYDGEGALQQLYLPSHVKADIAAMRKEREAKHAAANANGGEEDADVSAEEEESVDIFDAAVNPADFVEEEYLHHLEDFFSSATAPAASPLIIPGAPVKTAEEREGEKDLSGRISYEKFVEWEEIQFFLQKRMALSSVDVMWRAAVDFQKGIAPQLTMENVIDGATETDEVTEAAKKETLGWDAFVRLRIRLEVLNEEIEYFFNQYQRNHVNKDYYREQFLNLTQGADKIHWQQFMRWADVQDALRQSLITEEEIAAQWGFYASKIDSIADAADAANALNAEPSAEDEEYAQAEKDLQEFTLKKSESENEKEALLDLDGFIDMAFSIEEIIQTKLRENEGGEDDEDDDDESANDNAQGQGVFKTADGELILH